jgi:hypothetical protein
LKELRDMTIIKSPEAEEVTLEPKAANVNPRNAWALFQKVKELHMSDFCLLERAQILK